VGLCALQRLCTDARPILSASQPPVPSDSMSQFTPSLCKLSFPTPTRVEDHMIDLAWVFFTILLFACIPLSGWIAERRGRSIKFWCWMGFIFGPIAPLVVALLPATPTGPPPGSSAPNDSGPWRRRHGQAPGESAANLTAALSWCAPRRKLVRCPS
jgi:MFS family permease